MFGPGFEFYMPGRPEKDRIMQEGALPELQPELQNLLLDSQLRASCAGRRRMECLNVLRRSGYPSETD